MATAEPAPIPPDEVTVPPSAPKTTPIQPPPVPAQQAAPPPAATTDPTGRKLASFTLFDQTYPVTRCKALLTQLYALLVARHSDNLGDTVMTIKGRKRQYFAPSAPAMLNPAPIAGVDLYVETNLSAKNIVKLSHRRLVALEDDPNTLWIDYSSTGQPRMAEKTQLAPRLRDV